jgi:hypothetical protein
MIAEGKEGRFDVIIGAWKNEKREKWMAISN